MRDQPVHLRVIGRAMTPWQALIMVRHTHEQTHLGGGNRDTVAPTDGHDQGGVRLATSYQHPSEGCRPDDQGGPTALKL
jgi:hypothetical protein